MDAPGQKPPTLCLRASRWPGGTAVSFARIWPSGEQTLVLMRGDWPAAEGEGVASATCAEALPRGMPDRRSAPFEQEEARTLRDRLTAAEDGLLRLLDALCGGARSDLAEIHMHADRPEGEPTPGELALDAPALLADGLVRLYGAARGVDQDARMLQFAFGGHDQKRPNIWFFGRREDGRTFSCGRDGAEAIAQVRSDAGAWLAGPGRGRLGLGAKIVLLPERLTGHSAMSLFRRNAA